MSINTTPKLDLSKYVDTSLMGDRPHVRGRRVPIATVAHCHRDPGWDIARLAEEFTLSESEVLASLLYYAEHSEQIEKQEAAYQAQLDEAYRLHEQD